MPELKKDPDTKEIYRRLTSTEHAPSRDEWEKSGRGEIVIDETWSLADETKSEMVAVALSDLRNFLRTGMRVSLPAKSPRVCRVGTASVGGGKRDHKIEISDDSIIITGETEWGAAAGLYHLQRLLKLRRAPFIKKGVVTGSPSLDPALAHPAFKSASMEEIDYPEAYEEGYLLRMARAGYTGFHLNLSAGMFWRSAILPELDNPRAEENMRVLANVTARARRCSLEVHLTIYLEPLPGGHPLFQRLPEVRGSRVVGTDDSYVLCGSSRMAVDFHREQFHQLFTRVPWLAGAILIVGCEGWLHCHTAPATNRDGSVVCPRCAAKKPEESVARMVNAIAAAIKKANLEALCVVWTYGIFAWTDSKAVRFVSKLSKDCVLMSNFDTGDSFALEGARGVYFDYSLSCEGPGSVYTAQTEAARRNGLKTMAKCENASPLEFCSVQSVPALTRWSRKYANILKSKASGALFNWKFIGYTEALSAELAGWMSWLPPPPGLLGRLAARDFGKDNAAETVRAWRLFDRAMDRHPFSIGTAGYFKGPFYIGFTQPLVLDALDTIGMPREFWSSSKGTRGSGKALFVADLSWTRPFGVDACLRALQKMESVWSEGDKKLQGLNPHEEDAWLQGKIVEHQALSRGILCMIRTAANMVEFFDVRDSLHRKPVSYDEFKKKVLELGKIARRELENTNEGLCALRKNPMLGFSRTYRRGFSEEMCLAKISHTENLIKNEIPRLLYEKGFFEHRRPEWLAD